MESETYEIDGTDTAPALYTVLVSSSDDALMRPLYEQITRETAGFVATEAKRKGYVFVGEPLVRFMVDPSLKSGKFAVFAENVDASTLARLREEERAFLGGNSSVGGAAALVQQPYSGHAGRGGRRGEGRLTPIPEQGGPASPEDSAIAGLDVMPMEYGSMDPIPVAASPSSSTPMPVPVMGQPAVMTPLAPQPVPVDMPAVSESRPSHMRNVPLVDARQMAAAQAQAPSGHPAAYDDPQAAGQPDAAPQTSAAPSCLLIDRQTGRTYTAQAPTAVIGRERSQSDIVLRDPNVSRRHAELQYDGRDWHIVDLRSTNGTLVNDIDVDECVLRDGDLITMGLVNLEFRENQQ